MPSYVPVPAHEIESFLESKGFRRTVQNREVVYVRGHAEDPCVLVKVYTSIQVGAPSARARGKDSIKVCTVFDNGRKSFGVGRFPRIHRTGSPEAVLGRTYQRMRDAYARGTEWIRQQAIRRASQAPDEDRAWKAAFARRERRQEEAAFMSDPDFRRFATPSGN